MNSIEASYRSFIKRRFPLPSERQVADLEQRIRIPLPPKYRQFLLDYNGGRFTEPDIVPPSKDCPLDCLTFLNGIGATHPSMELASASDLAIFDDNDPPQILPIGYTIMGNLIFLITHPDDNGVIALKLAYSQQSFHLAPNIEEFFGLLREPLHD